jgi:hypothetical protein
MRPHLLDSENEHDYVWAGSAYSGERFEGLLRLWRASLWLHDHVYGWKADKNDWAIKKQGLVGPQNLTLNFLRYLQRSSHITAAA